MTKEEKALGIVGYRPHQIVLSLTNGDSPACGRKITGTICLDATDIALANDLRNLTDMLLIPANNRDVETFDDLAASLSFLMFQHVGIVNTGEYGGSVMRAPYKERYERVMTHHHGGSNASVTIVDVTLDDYGPSKSTREMKPRPAGSCRHRS